METTIAISAICLTVIGLLFQWFVRDARRDERLTRIETKVDLFWNIVQEKMVDVFHSPDHKIRDNLMDKWKAHNIDLEELIELQKLICSHYNNGDKMDKLAATLVLAKIEVDISDKIKEQTKPTGWKKLTRLFRRLL